jgi:hypothetical protein
MQTIIDSICDILKAQYTTTPIDITNQPEGFNRPSFFVEFIQETRKDMNYYAYEGAVSVQVTYFAPLDEYYNVDTEAQYSAYETILGLFPRSIPVGDRYYYLDQIVGDMKGKEVMFTLDLTRRGSRPAETPAETADTIEINLQEG